MSQIHQHRLANGLILLAEPVAGAQSLAMSLLSPAGVAHEPADKLGVATVLAEMVCRGAGGLDARAHSEALDQLGVQRGTGVETTKLHLGATLIGDKIGPALPLLLDMFLRPALDESTLGPSVDLALQSLDALEDEPQQKVFVELRDRHYPAPFGRSSLGRREDLESLTLKDVKSFWKRQVVAGGSILAFAGRFDWEELKDQVGELLGKWGGTVPEPKETSPGQRGVVQQSAETTQVHIGLAYDAPPEPDPASILQRAAAAALSGGMSGRLFTEVREKRGLVYSVYAAYAGQKDRGAMLAYAGTTAPRAQETLDVLVGELRRICAGVEAGEFERAIVGMKSRLVMQGESTGARAHAIAADQAILGRPRTLEELAALVGSVTLDKLNAYLREHPPGAMTLVTIGPAPLTMPG
ncbi:MAG: pitrilysin family protein [Planctomycetota bacterium]|nr:pitrilysin family protein [Planctomycetota bacterium]